MKFDPTYNYTDLTKEENQTLWKFGELIKNLITIASDAERQKYIIGMGSVADEMAIDFESYFTLSYNKYLDNQLLNQEAFDELMLLDQLFEEHSGSKNPDFWDDSQLETNKDWETARQKAKYILFLLKMDNLDIECNHINLDKSNHRIGQQTIIRIIEKF